MPQPTGFGHLMLNVFDGSRKLISAGTQLLVTIIDGNRRTISRDFHMTSSLSFPALPVYSNFGDGYTVIVWAKGYKQAGFAPVSINPRVVQILDLMIIPEAPEYSFAEATWEKLQATHPELVELFEAGAEDTGADRRYSDLLDRRPPSLACLLNLVTAMTQIHLPTATPLDYITELIWDQTMAHDRCYAWAHPDLLNQVRVAATHGVFVEEPMANTFHTGATCSYKQICFGEANVQLTFHENDKTLLAGTECIKLELDMDYYRDLSAHGLFEVIPNALTGCLTDPSEVYVLRWIAGQRAGLPEFAPPYTIISA